MDKTDRQTVCKVKSAFKILNSLLNTKIMLKFINQEIRRNYILFISFLKFSSHVGTKQIPKITVPHRIVQKLEKEKLKNLVKKYKKPYVYKSNENLVITCKNKEHNHYKNQYYPNFSTKDLASHGWKHHKARGDHFTINAFQGNPALQSEVDSFDELKVTGSIVDALQKQKISKPTNIQSLVIPRLFQGQNVLYAAETGNGKTLGYLIPIIEKVLKMKRTFGDVREKKRETLNRPIAVVVAPSRELVQQIYDVTKSICVDLDINVDMKIGGQGTQRILREMEVKPLDILIASPGILSKMLSNRFFNLTHLSYTVFDEADTLFDDSFFQLTIQIMKKLKISVEKPVSYSVENIPCNVELSGDDEDHAKEIRKSQIDDNAGGLQVVMCGATMPQGMNRKLNEIIDMDAMEIVRTRHLHHISPHIPHKFIRLGASQKIEKLLELLQNNEKRGVKTVVFCNKPSTIYYILHSLQPHSLNITSLHGKLPVPVREGRYEAFKNGDFKTILCTDIASRGLDTVEAQHVINYDFPHFLSDYVHRVGRVGRVGGVGGSLVINFITYPWDVELLWKIEEAVRKKSELPNVNANIKRKLVSLATIRSMKEDLMNETPEA